MPKIKTSREATCWDSLQVLARCTKQPVRTHERKIDGPCVVQVLGGASAPPPPNVPQASAPAPPAQFQPQLVTGQSQAVQSPPQMALTGAPLMPLLPDDFFGLSVPPPSSTSAPHPPPPPHMQPVHQQPLQPLRSNNPFAPSGTDVAPFLGSQVAFDKARPSPLDMNGLGSMSGSFGPHWSPNVPQPASSKTDGPFREGSTGVGAALQWAPQPAPQPPTGSYPAAGHLPSVGSSLPSQLPRPQPPTTATSPFAAVQSNDQAQQAEQGPSLAPNGSLWGTPAAAPAGHGQSAWASGAGPHAGQGAVGGGPAWLSSGGKMPGTNCFLHACFRLQQWQCFWCGAYFFWCLCRECDSF